MSENKKRRNYFAKKNIVEQLHKLEEAGTALAYRKSLPLSTLNIQQLKSTRTKITLLLLLLVSVMVVAMTIFRAYEVALLVGGALCLLWLGTLSVVYLRIKKVLRAATKTVIRGIITDRFTREEFYGEKNEDGKRDTRIHEYLKIGDWEIRVTKEIYAAYRIGEAVELHLVELGEKARPYVLEDRKLADAGLM
jgi:hypothetical protein